MWNKCKLEVTIEFLKAWREYWGLRERKEGKEKKLLRRRRIIVDLNTRATPLSTLYVDTSDNTMIGNFW